MKENTISWEWNLAIGRVAPHFKQNHRISIAIWNIEESWVQYKLQKQPFLAKNWPKWLKMAENEGKSHILGFLLQFEILSTTEFDFTYKKQQF